MSTLLEIMISLVIILLALGIMLGTVSTAVKDYRAIEEKYLATLTAENVLHALAAGAEVPNNMNGFKISYGKFGRTLTVHVGSWTFKYEVGF